MDQTICLNMIVKDEAHIIEDTLTKLLKKVPIKYWVISDTGSTDDTIAKIEGFFKKHDIPGEIHHDAWKNFSHNRSRALEEAYNKTDYLLIFDADDEITGNFVLPQKLTADAYNLKLGSPLFAYERPLLINNRRKWEFKSVIHEFLSAKEPNMMYSKIDGDYFVVSGKSGARSQDPHKYLKDAQLLERSFEESLISKDELHNRYAFYCANSYKDAGMPEKAIDWYRKTLTLNGWSQEKYVSCVRLYELLKDAGKEEEGLSFLVRSHSYDNERLDGIYHLVNYYCCNGQPEVAYAYYSLIADHYEKNYSRNYLSDKLFVDVNVYKFFMPYYMVIVAERLRKYDLGIKMYKIVFEIRPEHVSDWHIRMFLFNMQFFMNHASKPFLKQAKDFVKWLMSRGTNVMAYDFLDSFKNYDIFPKPKVFTNDECVTSKNVLFYTGYSNEPWNYTYSLTNALGGSETAVAYLTSYFRKDYTIYVCGGVKEETVGNIHYVPIDKIGGLVRSTPFRAVVISRYIGFLEQYTFSAHKIYIWAHDTHLLPYGCNLSTETILSKYSRNIDGVVCLTQWHKELFQHQYPMIRDKIVIINNGLKEDLFNIEVPKTKNQFVYTSCSERGLNRLLDLWESILEKLPDAQLKIASYGPFPKNDDDIAMQKIIKKHPESITHLGKLGSKDLYTLLSSSEYWLYPTCWKETSCITALEMLRCGVICIYYSLAGLPNTMNGHGFVTSHGNEINTLLSLTDDQKSEAIRKGKEYAAECTWKNRSKVWEALLFDVPVNVLNLPSRRDRKVSMIKKFSDVNMSSITFVDGVDGLKLVATDELKKQFFGNRFMYRRGVIGTILGHMKIWKQFVEDDSRDTCVVLEDDVFLQDKFDTRLSKAVADFVNQKREFTYIGRFGVPSVEENDCDVSNEDMSSKYENLDWGNYGYILSKTGARKLVSYYSEHPFQTYLDLHTTFTNAGVPISYLNRAIVTSFYTSLLHPRDTDVKKFDYANGLVFVNSNPEVFAKDKYTFPIKIINLARRPDRKEKMIQRLESKRITGYEFVVAVDGKDLPEYTFIRDMFSSNHFGYNKAIIGAALSHMEIWKQLVHSDEEYCVVLEDDVILSYEFPDKLEKCIAHFKTNDADMMYIAANMIRYCTNCDVSELVIEKHDTAAKDNCGAYGYILSKRGATKLLDYVCKYGLESAIDAHELYDRSKIDCYIVNDNIVQTQMAIQMDGKKITDVDSDIQYNDDRFTFDNAPRHANVETIARRYFFLEPKMTLHDAETQMKTNPTS